MTADEKFMRLALGLARRGLGRTSPNPPVGAVVVRNGRVVGKGYHRRAGGPHAEVEALQQAGPLARGATLFVTLEPCNHHGRTPPCTEAVLAAGLRRVTVATRDPNPHVKGAGLARLRKAGIDVRLGVEEEACRELIQPFAKHTRTGLPFVTLKLAASLDGRIATATGESRWITGEPARRMVQKWRNEVDAVMVGAGTVRADDPALTCRRPGGRDPLRILVSGRLRIPSTARVLTNDAASGTLIVTVSHPSRKIDTLKRRGVRTLELPGRNGTLPLRHLFETLGREGILSVMIEGGATLAAAALRERLVDRLLLFLAPKLIGGDGRALIGSLGVRKMSDVLELPTTRVTRVGADILVRTELGASHAV